MNELKRTLEKWEAPKPSARLDKRVWDSVAQSRHPSISWKIWGALAAGVLLVLATNLFSPAKPKATSDRTHVETRLLATGFRPIPEGAVTVVKVGAK